MYNRYTPQPDGSYRRSPAQDTPRPPAPAPRPPSGAEVYPPPSSGHSGPLGIGSFFRQLLPGNFDTEDLLIVLLLLLMSPDQGEDQSWPLLTLALYLFL